MLGRRLALRIGRTDRACEKEDRQQHDNTAHAGSHA
jgi:hypothetical protein